MIPFTKIGYQNLLNEQKKLLGERPAAVQELQRAREMGDLKENGFYRGAKWKLSGIDRRLKELIYLIKQAKIISGSTFVITDGKEIKSFELVGEFETNPSANKISYKSPVGKALLGKKAGDSVTISIPSGEILYRIIEIK